MPLLAEARVDCLEIRNTGSCPPPEVSADADAGNSPTPKPPYQKSPSSLSLAVYSGRPCRDLTADASSGDDDSDVTTAPPIILSLPAGGRGGELGGDDGAIRSVPAS
jgi:hypothetical protein